MHIYLQDNGLIWAAIYNYHIYLQDNGLIWAATYNYPSLLSVNSLLYGTIQRDCFVIKLYI